MKLEEAKSLVETIRRIAYDDEAAHSAEDQLRQDVLKAYAAGLVDGGALAEVALSTNDIDFERWCA